MKGLVGYAVFSVGLMLIASCASAPEGPSSDSVDSAEQRDAAVEGPADKGIPIADVETPVEQPSAVTSIELSEPPQLFPEASLAPGKPVLRQRNAPVTLPTPADPVFPAADRAVANAAPANAAPANGNTRITDKTGGSSDTVPVTVQKGSSTGSSGAKVGPGSTDKTDTVVAPESLKAPEPKPDTAIVREISPVPVASIPELPAKTNPALAEDKVVLSRTVRATVGQLVEIPYQGAGWVYLGEVGGKKGLAYDSRRLDTEGQTFVFRCEAPGLYTVKFFKQDFIKDYTINDYVEVVVGENPVSAGSGMGAFSLPIDRGRVVAQPRWPTTVAAVTSTGSATAPATGKAAAAATTTTAASTDATAVVNTPAAGAGTGAVAQTAPAATAASAQTATAAAPASAGTTPASSSPSQTPASSGSAAPASLSPDSLTQPEEFINRARTEYTAGQYASALTTLRAFTAKYPAGSDEAWWLFGQILEAKGPQRDIKGALSYYKRLLNEYPQSRRYQDAQERITYLERFYFDIR